MLLIAILATSLFLAITLGAISVGLLQQKLIRYKVASAQALHVAEAGVNYYRWVLYHEKNEYCNHEPCQGAPDYGPYGPYEYTDMSGNVKGYYELYITPPPQNGSTIVVVKSVGWLEKYPNIKRTIEVRVGIPSWSTYSGLANSFVRYGTSAEVYGRVHSNVGIRFDGIAHNLVTSAVLDYDDPDHSGPNEFGVHTHVNPIDPLPDGNNPPQNVPDRPDVFMAGREFPVPIISFDLLDSYVNDALNMATSSGGMVLEPSGALGYHITLNPDDTIDIRVVTTDTGDCFGTPLEGISAEVNFAIGTSTPPNGIIFVKDKVWLDGQVDGNRVTVLAFREPITGNSTDIIINNDLLYTHYDGSDAIGVIAQRNVLIGYNSEDDLRIDGAIIAKEGMWGRNYYSSWCGSSWTRTQLTMYGSRATRLRSGVAYGDGSGYQNRTYIYDNNLTFAPPPHFPTTGEYTFISWRER